MNKNRWLTHKIVFQTIWGRISAWPTWAFVSLVLLIALPLFLLTGESYPQIEIKISSLIIRLPSLGNK